MDDHVAPLLREREGGLALEVEVLLPADLDLALDREGARRQRVRGVARGPHAGSAVEVPVAGRERRVEVEHAGRGSISTRPSRAARRAARWEVATTRNTGWPMWWTTPSASSGSSWAEGETSGLGSRSAAASAATTPGAARAAARSTAVISPWAVSLSPNARCRQPAGAGMSST